MLGYREEGVMTPRERKGARDRKALPLLPSPEGCAPPLQACPCIVATLASSLSDPTFNTLCSLTSNLVLLRIPKEIRLGSLEKEWKDPWSESFLKQVEVTPSSFLHSPGACKQLSVPLALQPVLLQPGVCHRAQWLALKHKSQAGVSFRKFTYEGLERGLGVGKHHFFLA